MAYDPSDFGQNSPEESAAAFGNAMDGNFTASDFKDDRRDSGPATVIDMQRGVKGGRSDVKSKQDFGDAFGEDTTYGNQAPAGNGILSIFQKLIGYKPNLSMSKNMYNMLVPGQNTPLGGLTFLSPALGLDRGAQMALSLANKGIGSLIGPAKTQAEIDATPVYDMRTQPPGPPTNMGIESGYQGAGLPSISMQSLPQLYGDNFYE